MNTLSKTRDLVLAAVIAAIIVIMAFVPFLGYIPLGFMNATTVHIPVIIGAIILGPKYGAFLGLTFGLTSLWKNTFMPNPTSFVFSPFVTMGQFHGNLGSLVICLVPRILIGVVAYYVYRLFMRTLKNRRNKQGTALFAAGVAGSLTNTLLGYEPDLFFVWGSVCVRCQLDSQMGIWSNIGNYRYAGSAGSPGGRNYCDGCSRNPAEADA